eukprot:m.57298 g.57298  ORF g.57298 m.57298 type:complete len:195 (+) comp34709_c0_seq3:944-1528(+)
MSAASTINGVISVKLKHSLTEGQGKILKGISVSTTIQDVVDSSLPVSRRKNLLTKDASERIVFLCRQIRLSDHVNDYVDELTKGGYEIVAAAKPSAKKQTSVDGKDESIHKIVPKSEPEIPSSAKAINASDYETELSESEHASALSTKARKRRQYRRSHFSRHLIKNCTKGSGWIFILSVSLLVLFVSYILIGR